MFKLRLREHRILKGISQKGLAKKAGLSQEYISKLENFHRCKSPTLHTVEIIAAVLEVCPLELLECHCKFCLAKED